MSVDTSNNTHIQSEAPTNGEYEKLDLNSETLEEVKFFHDTLNNIV